MKSGDMISNENTEQPSLNQSYITLRELWLCATSLG